MKMEQERERSEEDEEETRGEELTAGTRCRGAAGTDWLLLGPVQPRSCLTWPAHAMVTYVSDARIQLPIKRRAYNASGKATDA